MLKPIAIAVVPITRQKGDYDLAIENYTKAIQFNSNYAEAYCGRGSAYINRG